MARFRKTNRKFNIYRQPSIAKRVSEKTGYDVTAVDEVMQAAEEIIMEMLFEANEHEDVAVYPFKGMLLKSEYKEAEHFSHPLKKEGCTVPAGIRLHAAFSTAFRKEKEKEYRDYIALYKKVESEMNRYFAEGRATKEERE